MSKYLLWIGLLTWSCQRSSHSTLQAKQLIIETLNKETQFFCERNLTEWQKQWSHKDFISKMYAGKIEFEELIGWEAINQFTVNHIKNNPSPIPIPKTSPDYNIELFDNTALVFYSKTIENKVIRETRFMVKEGPRP